MMGAMQFELRVVPDCPHRRPAVALFRDVLDAGGLAAAGFEIVIIDNAAALPPWTSRALRRSRSMASTSSRNALPDRLYAVGPTRLSRAT
jgi:hypothetical protein